MKITVLIEKNGKTAAKSVEAATVKEALGKLRINPVTVLAVRNNVLVSESAKLSKGDTLKILPVVSGG